MARTRDVAVLSPAPPALVLEGFVLKESHREVARCLALGYTHEQTGKLTGYTKRQVTRIAPLVQYLVDQARTQVEDLLEQDVYSNLRLALDIERKMLGGEIAPSDARYKEAKVIVQSLRTRLFNVEPRQTAAGPVSPQPPT